MCECEKIAEQLTKLDEIYMKAKEYDKITKFGKAPMRCNFCGKELNSVLRLITSKNGVCICEECIILSNEILKNDYENYDELKEKILSEGI